MDELVPESALSELRGLRWELQSELKGLVEKRSRLESQLQALSKQLETLGQRLRPSNAR
jgi:predicted  nucleic acid-binding Zn-ribbon protein